MAGNVINVTAGSQAILTLGTTAPMAIPDADEASHGMRVATVQDITVNSSPGIVRYSVLDDSASQAFTTVNENSVSLNILLNDDQFFGNASLTDNAIETNGLFLTQNNKTEIFFSVAFDGTDSGANYVYGTGFLSGLAPSASLDQAIWISSLEIAVNGELAKDVLA